jgi:hypothetical protein
MSGVKMKKLFCKLLFLLVLLSVLGGCAATKEAISEQDFFKAWGGTWSNTELPGNSWVPQKIVAYPDGTRDIYVFGSDSISQFHVRLTLIDQWADSKGVIWYKAHLEVLPNGIEGYEYGKISDSGNTFECINHASSDPIEKWEPDNDWYNYGIYYRG